MKRLLASLGFLWACGWCPAMGQAEGIFADFETTKGDFTVRLEPERAPRAVASFVGLATGELGWADPKGNVWQDRPFYDGTIFHRVATNDAGVPLCIQGGGARNCVVETVDRPVGATTNEYEGVLVATNAPGVTTNLLNLPVPAIWLGAVPTNYVMDGEAVATNAPMLTLVRIDATVVSSNRLIAGIVHTNTLRAGCTNFGLVALETTLVHQVAVVMTNGTTGSVATTHFISLQAVSSNRVRAPGVATNFANAGYRMLDAATNGLAHSNGVISMANSGPNTDGSQFFLTTTNVPGWDGGYTVFGHVTTGMDVVAAIAAVPLAGERPAQDVVLNRVSIRREGGGAVAFDIASQGVPVVESTPMSVTPSGTNLALRVEFAEQSETLFRESRDLRTWENSDWGFWTNADTVSSGEIAKADLGGLYFFHAMRIRYLVPITAPATHRSRVYTFVWSTNPPGMYEAHFAANELTPGVFQELNGGAYTNGQLLSAWESWAQDAYSARLISLDQRNYMNYYSLGFDPGAVTNRFTCRRVNQYTGQSVVFSGTFTVE